jgi:hypothetical protein
LPKKTFEIAKKKGCELIIQVKANQPKLFEAVKKSEVLAKPHSEIQTFNHERSRLEKRRIKVFDAQDILINQPEWDHFVYSIIQVYRDTDIFGDTEKNKLPGFKRNNHIPLG